MRKKEFWRRRLLMVAGVGVVVIVAGGIGAWLYFGNQPKPVAQIPSGISDRLRFPVYLPSRLPGGFSLVVNSYSLDQGVLIFKAQDSSGMVMAFTEQAKPDKFDFANFYSEQLTNPQTLDNVPFASVSGKNTQQYNVLSIVTDKTWIIVSTRAPLAQNDLQVLAQNMQLHTN